MRVYVFECDRYFMNVITIVGCVCNPNVMSEINYNCTIVGCVCNPNVMSEINYNCIKCQATFSVVGGEPVVGGTI